MSLLSKSEIQYLQCKIMYSSLLNVKYICLLILDLPKRYIITNKIKRITMTELGFDD
ncbi:hypothetical protein BH23THE1_BH23THE1_23900 [soil metagenome]